MYKFLFLFLLFSSEFVFSQNIQKIEVTATGQEFQSTTTEVGKTYRITVEGTYSMWPQYQDCHGVDAVYIYDVPQEEIDAFRWPPEKIKIGSFEVPFVELPHWVGDEKLWTFPPKEIATPLFKLSFRKIGRAHV